MEAKTELKVLGWYQVLGWLVGYGLIGSLLLNNYYLKSGTVIILLIVLALYSFSVYCGLLLIKGQIKGLWYSIFHQMLQIISVMAAGYKYEYFSGTQLSAGVDLTNQLVFKFNASFSGFKLGTAASPDTLRLMVNLVPLVPIGVMNKLHNELEAVEDSVNL